MRRVRIAAALLTALWIAGCATERLGASAPNGVNLSGEWNFNPSLSDDPDKLGEPDKVPQRTPGSHRGHGGGRGGGGGIPPIGSHGGSGSNYRLVASTAPGIEPATPLPSAGTPDGATATRGASISRLLRAPVHVSISQKADSVLIRTNMPDGTQTVDDYAAGTATTIPYGREGTADRSVGWRGPVFVVITSVKKGGWREDDFALDEDGRLIMTLQTKGGRLGKLEIKRVYDRARGAQS